jgi:hypothetical protein
MSKTLGLISKTVEGKKLQIKKKLFRDMHILVKRIKKANDSHKTAKWLPLRKREGERFNQAEPPKKL